MLDPESAEVNIHRKVLNEEDVFNILHHISLHSSTIRRLSLVENGIGDEEIVKNNAATGNVNNFGKKIAPSIVQISQFLAQNPEGLEYVQLTGNPIGDEGAKMLAEGLMKNTHVKVLFLGNCGIGDEGVEALAHVVKRRNCTLQVLALNDSKITSNGAVFLGQALRQNISLRVLWLNDNSLIDDEGAVEIANALEENGSLKELWLHHCSIHETGVVAIARALAVNASLKSLWLQGCQVTERSMESFSHSLDQNSTLTDLHLDDSTEEAPLELSALINENASISSFLETRPLSMGDLKELIANLDAVTSVRDSVNLSSRGNNSKNTTTTTPDVILARGKGIHAIVAAALLLNLDQGRDVEKLLTLVHTGVPSSIVAYLKRVLSHRNPSSEMKELLFETGALPSKGNPHKPISAPKIHRHCLIASVTNALGLVKNASNDAETIANHLHSLGFVVVKSLEVSRLRFWEAFDRSLQGINDIDDFCLVFLGPSAFVHETQESFLIPAFLQANQNDDDDKKGAGKTASEEQQPSKFSFRRLEKQAIPLSRVFSKLESRRQGRSIVLLGIDSFGPFEPAQITREASSSSSTESEIAILSVRGSTNLATTIKENFTPRTQLADALHECTRIHHSELTTTINSSFVL